MKMRSSKFLPKISFQILLSHFLFSLCFFQRLSKTADKYSGGFFDFVGVAPRVLGTSSITYISILFIPIAGMAFDVCGKVFSNMYYPTQTQIHVELESRDFAEKRKSRRRHMSTNQSNADRNTWRA